MKYILLILIAFASCKSVAKQQRKAEDFIYNHPEKLALWCWQKIPPDTIYKQGTTITKADTIVLKADSIECPPVINQQGETIIVKAKCPDSKIIRDTIFRVDTITKVDNAALTYISYHADSLKTAMIKASTQRDDAKKTAKNRLWWIIGLSAALAGSAYFNVKKLFI